jgi:hypothetical protein
VTLAGLALAAAALLSAAAGENGAVAGIQFSP